MPGGVLHPSVGYLSFCAIKFVGYSMVASTISDVYGREKLSSWKVGGVRTLIGMAVGAAYYAAWQSIPEAGMGFGGLGYLVGLLPLRICEWWFLLWLFYDRSLERRALSWRTVGSATLWSYALDIPALMGFLVTGGLSIC